MGRAPCCDKANVKKGPWSPEEDAKLKSYIEQHGTGGNWIALPQKIGLKRCGKSCRLRWLNYLRPNIKHGDFSEEEDRIICSLYVSIGSRWSIIAAQLPGRTDNDIKNYWNTRLKKKLFGKHHERQQQLVRRGRKIKTEIGNSMAIVFDDHVHNQSHYLPELSSAPPYANYQDHHTAARYENHHHESIGNSLTKLVGGRFSDQQSLRFPPQFPSNSQQLFGLTGDDLCRTVDAAAQTQFAVDGAAVGLPIPSCHVGELEKLVYNNTPSFDDGLQFLYEEDETKNDNNGGLISDCDWGEMSSLISAPLYPSTVHDQLMIGSSFLEQQIKQ